MIALGGALLLGTLVLLYLFVHARPAVVKSSLVWGAGANLSHLVLGLPFGLLAKLLAAPPQPANFAWFYPHA